MNESKTHFEQVSLEIVKGIIEQQDGLQTAAAKTPGALKRASDASVSRTGSRQSSRKP